MKKSAPIALAAAGLFALTACSSTDSTETESGIALVTPDTLTVCTNPPFAPFEYKDDSGAVVGIDMDIMAEVAQDLSLELSIVEAAFDAMQSGASLESNQCDVIATGMTITDERAERFDFSDPYYDANQGVLVPAGTSISSLTDLSDLQVAVQIETTGATLAEEQGLDSTVFEDLGLVVQSVATGQTDAAIGDVGTLTPYVTDELTIAFVEETNERYGFGVKKGNEELVASINTTLERIMGDDTLNTIIETHIDAPAAQ
ncbi:transporter substrate-binding domain-containing protein [Jonesia quinghaiensis]|uniref:transporter substrate-binding domain-containing protein n=1 Tax=Jonesia quinghaiensis TaxID=262806 RepID=UPI0003F9B060|nr:transporter substrate-binding domain-containing protein [Jonesia quinghaiensis]